jgi:hypothetical protein
MFVHLDPRLFERRPFLGILLGAGSLALWIFLFAMLFHEYRGFGETPASVDLSKIMPPAENHGKWVRIEQALSVHCSLGIQEAKDPPESWFFGRIDQTMFMAGIEGSDRNLLLVYAGDVRCGDVSKEPLVGVLEEINSRRRSHLVQGRFVFPPKADLQLSVGEGPASYRRMMICH